MSAAIHVGADEKSAASIGDAICRILNTCVNGRLSEGVTKCAIRTLRDTASIGDVTISGCHISVGNDRLDAKAEKALDYVLSRCDEETQDSEE